MKLNVIKDSLKWKGLFLVLFSVCMFSCNENLDSAWENLVEAGEKVVISGDCANYEISADLYEDWILTDFPEWITPISYEGKAGERIRIYVESNPGESRNGEIEVTYKNGGTRSVEIAQNNVQSPYSIQRSYAAGWSFDVRTYADFRGLRNQIINTQKLNEYDDDIYRIEDSKTSHIDYYYGESGSEISEDMNGKLSIDGKFNSFSLDLQASFGKTALNNSKRIFSRIRASFQERVVYLNQFDPLDAQEEELFTADFASERKRVIDTKGSDEAIRELIDRYGTHFVIKASLGGFYEYFFSSVVENMNDLLNVEAAIKLGFAEKFKLNGDAKYKDDLEKLNKERIEKFTVKGGDAIALTMAVEDGTINQSTTDEWLNSLIDGNKYELLTFQLLPLSIFFPSDIRAKINNYTDRMYYNQIPVTRSESN